MAVNYTIPPYFIAILFITRLMSTVGLKSSKQQLLPPKLLSSSLNFADKIHTDLSAVKSAAADYGNLVHKYPAAVLHPSSVDEIVNLIKFAYNYNNSNSPPPFTISARGRSHSVHGQAMAQNGVVVDMMMLRSYINNEKNNGVRVYSDPVLGYYADVGGEQMWIDVLKETIEFGLAPVSWTDYLYLTVGGTLSNAGISGQSFRYGPQISNVFEMDVITGKGELVTCSEKKNSELYYGVLGGLGQFGIITRARIALDPAPKRVKWVRMLYSDFSEFTKDQEKLISMNGRRESKALDYVEGSLIMNQGPPNNWRSSFFPSYDIQSIMSLVNQHHIIYCLEIAKYYDHSSQHSLDKDMEEKYKTLRFMKGFKYEKDVSYVEFLDRVRSGEEKLQSQGLWDVPHPWLNLFLPKSQISDFNSAVFRDIILKRNITTGPVLVYPMNKNKWDDRTSAVIPDEEILYTVGFLHSSKFDDWQVYDNQNKDILDYCEKNGIKIKQYFPHYTKKEEWMKHFGSKWKIFNERKAQFDPKMMLSPGQRIFN